MAGTQEVPAVSTAASGTCSATVDDATGNVTFTGSFSGLGGAATAAGLHGSATAGEVAPVVVAAATLSAATAGTFSGSATLAPGQVAGLLAGEGYCEVRDQTHPSGEIRGQLAAPAAVPAFPTNALALLALALGAFGVARGARAKA